MPSDSLIRSVRISQVEWERYRKAAEEQHISISFLIRQSVNYCLDRYDAKKLRYAQARPQP